jgi:hypothetical protein
VAKHRNNPWLSVCPTCEGLTSFNSSNPIDPRKELGLCKPCYRVQCARDAGVTLLTCMECDERAIHFNDTHETLCKPCKEKAERPQLRTRGAMISRSPADEDDQRGHLGRRAPSGKRFL